MRVAHFKVVVEGPQGTAIMLTALPRIHAEGKLESAPHGVKEPSVVGFSAGSVHASGCRLLLAAVRQEVGIDVAFHADYGVTLTCAVEVLSA